MMSRAASSIPANHASRAQEENIAQKFIRNCGMGTVNSVFPFTVMAFPPAAIKSSTSTTAPAMSQSRWAAKNFSALRALQTMPNTASTTASDVPMPA